MKVTVHNRCSDFASYEWVHGSVTRLLSAIDSESLKQGRADVVMLNEGSSPITARRGYMRSCVWLSAAKSWSFSDWIVFIHKYGIPTTALFYDGNLAQYDQHKRVFEDILKALGDGRSAIIPDGNRIEPIQSPVGGARTVRTRPCATHATRPCPSACSAPP